MVVLEGGMLMFGIGILGIAIFIFLARILDVSVGTLKFKAVVRGGKLVAGCIAFIEIAINAPAAALAFKYIFEDWRIFIMLCFGYALGTVLGMVIDEKLAKGHALVLLITAHDDWSLADYLRQNDFGVTSLKGWGLGGTGKATLLIVVPRKRLKELKEFVKLKDSTSYVAVLDVTEARTIIGASTV